MTRLITFRQDCVRQATREQRANALRENPWRGRRVWIPLILVVTLLALVYAYRFPWVWAQEPGGAGGPGVSGRIIDPLGGPVHDVEVAALVDGHDIAAESTSQQDGSFLLDLPPGSFESVTIEIHRPHFESATIVLAPTDVTALREGTSVRLPDVALQRRVTAGFWVATLSFTLVLGLIALERLHKTTAALLGMSIVLGVSFVGGAINPNLFIFDFERALSYVDFDVIFLVMGMMIVIAVIEETGIFQWLAYQAYRLSGGRMWLLVTILIVITAVASALLDNVTTMLLMAPITIQISLTLGINPLALLIPEILASNVGGISTLIGTPTNILIGSYAGLGFNDFLLNLTPGVVAALIVLVIYVVLTYRRSYAATSGHLSDAMRDRLRKSAQITKPEKLRKSAIVFGIMLVFFVIGDAIHLVPAVTAIIGAVAMLLWVSPDIEEMLQVVDWTTLMFFIALFIAVGALQEVGLISFIATAIGNLVGDNLTATILVLVWSAAILSGVIDNIPFAATMLPVVGYLTRTVPGAGSGVLWYALSIGAAMGGNSTLIGASPNLVTAGIAERAGYRITYLTFLKVGFPAMVVTVTVGTIWLFLHF